MALLAALGPAAGAARAAEGPPALSAPSAILIEASTGEVVYRARGREAPLDRLHDEADDRAAHRGGGAAVRQGPGVRLHRRADRVQAEPAPGRAALGRRPAARADARVRQRRRRHAGRARRRLAHGLRAPDEQARAGVEAREHALLEPDRARCARQLLLGARSGAARGAPAQPQVHPQGRRPHVGDARHRRPDAHDPQPQHAALEGPGRQRAEDRPYDDGRLRAGRHALAPRRHARLGRARHAVAGRARPRRARAAAVGRRPLRADPSGHRGQRRRHAGDRVPARCDAHARHRGLGQAHGARRGGDHDQRRRRPEDGHRPGQARPALRLSRGARGRQADRRRADRLVGLRPGRRPAAAHQGLVHATRRRCCSRPSCWAVRCSWLAGCDAVRRAAASARSRRPHDPHRHPQHCDRQDPGGAELPPRPASPHGRADDVSRAARASTWRASSRRSAPP